MLIVEDGTGLPDAESYVSVAEADAYHAMMGNLAWPAVADKEAALRRATQYIDANYVFIGEVLDPDQALEWPRDTAMWPVRGVQRATAELALRAASEPLFEDETTGEIESMSAGSVAIKYRAGSLSGQTRFAVADALLRPYTASRSTIRVEVA